MSMYVYIPNPSHDVLRAYTPNVQQCVLICRPRTAHAVAGEGKQFPSVVFYTDNRKIAFVPRLELCRHVLQRTWLIIGQRCRVGDCFVEDAEDRLGMPLE